MEEGSEVNIKYRKIKWTILKVIISILLLCSGVVCILLGIHPLIDIDIDLKALCNLIFVVFHLFYIFSFFTVKTNSDFVFWSSSCLLLIITSIMFYYYDDIFI